MYFWPKDLILILILSLFYTLDEHFVLETYLSVLGRQIKGKINWTFLD